MASMSLSDSYPRDIFRGLMKYAHEHQRFAIRFHDQDRHSLEDLTRFATYKSAVGAVVFGGDQSILKTARQLNIPVVNVSNSMENADLPAVLLNNHKVGEIAAKHLLKKGCRSHVFIHLPDQQFSTRRMMGWQSALQHADTDGLVIPFTRFVDIMRVLEDLPRPLALTTATDHLGRSLLDRCLNVGWSVPDEVAVLGCSNNELVCEGGLVTLSSVSIKGEKVGMTASKMLIDMIDGHPPPSHPLLVEPGEVVERESTDLIRFAEPSISDAIRFIRTHACNGIQITDILEATGLSRATLDRQVKKLLGHSPHHEIKRLQMERARHLLVNTHLPLAEISSQCGYKEPNYFMRVFREDVGRTPTQFRRDILSKADANP